MAAPWRRVVNNFIIVVLLSGISYFQLAAFIPRAHARRLASLNQLNQIKKSIECREYRSGEMQSQGSAIAEQVYRGVSLATLGSLLQQMEAQTVHGVLPFALQEKLQQDPAHGVGNILGACWRWNGTHASKHVRSSRLLGANSFCC